MVTKRGDRVPGLHADFRVRRGDFTLDLRLDVAEGEVIALVGPNGAGKSTTLRTLAGLLPPDAGTITLGDRILDDAGSHRPAHRRAVAVVFQDYLLFPHLTVLDNVAFGLRATGEGRAASRRRAQHWLARMDAVELAELRPQQLSGGQAQRVALARALATDPELLLLDEPLAALDARTRLTVRGELRRHLADFPGAAIVITHDPTDAAVLADRLVVIEHGKVVQTGTREQVAGRPRTDYVARLVGLNLLIGDGVDHGVRLDDGTMINTGRTVSGRLFAAFRPAAVALWRERPEGSPRNVWPVLVDGLEPIGDSVRVELIIGARPGGQTMIAEITPAAVAELGLDHGHRLWASLKASEIEVYPAD
ncbi:ATP-binding cassette domain-containing protein [Microlunatus elymi]|uniref:ATP-binding cassette domain-containing protein n=1 Tax=Microlunatus elymi TaxID=2596828 RepID=A0A516PWE4_9ACTN|nr:ABC transporter ATP-binding protein [Microlunatus elymi]QDP95497.1 ATP-binding cassette domain-containing protein [Microlunatus elymi]